MTDENGRKHWLPVFEASLHTRWGSATVSTPDFNIVTRRLRPRPLPRLETTDLGGISDVRYLTTLTWFFHLTLGYGRPLPRAECPAGFGDD